MNIERLLNELNERGFLEAVTLIREQQAALSAARPDPLTPWVEQAKGITEKLKHGAATFSWESYANYHHKTLREAIALVRDLAAVGAGT